MKKKIASLSVIAVITSIILTSFITNAYSVGISEKFVDVDTGKMQIKSIEHEGTVEIAHGFNDDELNELSPIVLKETLAYKGEEYPLYVTFENQEDALTNLKNTYAELLERFATEYELSELTEDNWKTYQQYTYNYWECFSQDLTEDEAVDFYNILGFFDIYENVQDNTKIKEAVFINNTNIDSNGFLKSSTTMENETLTNLVFMLPQDSSDTLRDNVSISMAANTTASLDTSYYSTVSCGPSFNITKAVNYAAKYAVDPNESNYRYFSNGDCTNFISQIIYAGGVKMNDSWWYNRAGNSLTWMFDTWSHSWSVADDFAKYYYVSYRTTSYAPFSRMLSKGDTTCADWKNDGSWDHLGFVTEMGSTVSDTSINFKIAQHTSNYHNWSRNTGWLNVGANGGKYGRIAQYI